MSKDNPRPSGKSGRGIMTEELEREYQITKEFYKDIVKPKLRSYADMLSDHELEEAKNEQEQRSSKET